MLYISPCPKTLWYRYLLIKSYKSLGYLTWSCHDYTVYFVFVFVLAFKWGFFILFYIDNGFTLLWGCTGTTEWIEMKYRSHVWIISTTLLCSCMFTLVAFLWSFALDFKSGARFSFFLSNCQIMANSLLFFSCYIVVYFWTCSFTKHFTNPGLIHQYWVTLTI